jgi:hypothetical protein
MKIISLVVLLFVTVSVICSQNLVGYKNDEIRKFMKENRTDMNFVPTTNNKFLYLKYTDNSESQTLLFFLNPDSVCKSVTLIFDKAAKAVKVKEFNELYKKCGEYKWKERRGEKNYLLEMKDGKWSSIITINPDN